MAYQPDIGRTRFAPARRAATAYAACTEKTGTEKRLLMLVDPKLNRFCRNSRKNAKKFDEFLLNFLNLRGAKECKSCRSRKMLKNEYLVAKIGVDVADNGPSKL